VPIALQPTDDPHAYDDVVRSLPVTSALQGWGYGEARRALGHVPLRYLIRDGNRTVGAVQLLRKPLAPGLSLLYAPRGPVLDDITRLPDVAEAVRRVARPGDVRVLIEPPFPRSAHLLPELIGPWRRTEAEQPEHTIAVDLTKSEDDLLKNLHQMARRNVKKSAKLGVTAGRDDDFEAFWEIFTATNERAKLGAFPRAYYETMLREGGAYGGEAYIVLARHEGRALAGGFFLAMGGGTYYLYGGSIKDDRPTPDGEKRQDVQAPTAFYWNAMMDAKRRGYRFFDFWGIPRALDEGKHSFGVFKMKENFGGDKIWYPGYEYPLSPLAPLVTRALRLRKDFNNYRRRGTTSDVL
jgi:lipid II:glycine glycyltransferase (peptidoglycan interpeptide bridge formation enzyme)